MESSGFHTVVTIQLGGKFEVIVFDQLPSKH
jgi:hypothetical protein